jgi:hypothetical protein
MSSEGMIVAPRFGLLVLALRGLIFPFGPLGRLMLPAHDVGTGFGSGVM